MNDLVIMQNQQAVTSSINIAKTFEKEHKNVLRDIDLLKKDMLNFEQVFFETTEPDSYGRDRRTFLMNRDGFALLAMGFTGTKALQFKLDYLKAFNEMEEKLKQEQPAHFQLPQTYKDALLQLVEKVEENEKLQTEKLTLEQQNKELQPKASYYDLVLHSDGLLSVSKISKDYGMGAPTLNKKLKELGIQYKQGGVWLLYAKYQDRGYTTTKTFKDTGAVHTYWTQKGRLFIYDLLKQNGILPVIEREEERESI